MLPPSPPSLAMIAVSPFVGSFLGTLALRLPLGESVVLARSRCPACGTALQARDLVPLFSWLALRGRCRHCPAEIPLFYPAMEVASFAVVVWAALAVDEMMVVLPTAILGWILLTLAVTDWRALLLPRVLTLCLALSGMALSFLPGGLDWTDRFAGLAGGYILLASVAAIYRLVRGREGLGGGDAKLLAAIGAWTGWAALPTVMIYAAAIGCVMVAAQRIRGKSITAETPLPFGTFLATGGWLVWLYGPLEINF